VSTETPQTVDVSIAAESIRYDQDDERWLAQVNDLYVDLRREVTGFRTQATGVAGTKGVAEAVILSLGSAGAFSAAVQCFKAWLARDKSRRLAVTWTQGGREQRVILVGDAIDGTSLQLLVKAIGEHLGDGDDG
jgi:hypothetical protein